MFPPLLGYGLIDGYGTLNLTVASPPQSFVEPLSLSEVKEFLGLPARSPSEAPEDDLINVYISGARGQAEILQNRDLVRKQWDLSFDYWRDYYIRLRPHLYSVDLVQYKDSTGTLRTLAENTDYIVDTAKNPGLIAPVFNTTWPVFTPWPSSAILIRFKAGPLSTDPFWLDAGPMIKVGMRYLISAWFNNRLPYETGVQAIAEYPYTIQQCLSTGAVSRFK